MSIVAPRPFQIVLSLLLVTISLPAQTPSFDVISIKPNKTLSETSIERTAPGRFTATNVTLGELIQFAFGIRDFQLSGGPGWLRTDRFNILATTSTLIDLNDNLIEPYLQSLLKDRAGFRYHQETREMQTYSLTVAKDGPKLTASVNQQEDGTHEISHGAGKTTATASNSTMADLARILNRELARTVIDNTSLKGQFDLKLEWSPDSLPDSNAPSLATALQEQLGLKLESTKGPVEIIAVDEIEKPSEN